MYFEQILDNKSNEVVNLFETRYMQKDTIDHRYRKK